MRRRALALLLLIVLALLGSACSGDDEAKASATSTTERSTTTTTASKSGEELVGSIAATLSASVASLTDEQAHCLAQAIAETVGSAADGDLNQLPPAVQDAYVAALTAASDGCGVPLGGPPPG